MLSDDPDTATAQTVGYMAGYIHQAARDPLIIQIARRAVQTFKGGPGWALRYSPDEERRAAESCWWWCKWNLRFKYHGSMFETWSKDLGDPRTKLQLLIAPDVLVRMRSMEGDCAIYTMMLCALLEALGLPWEIVTLAVDRSQPEIFSHVCARSGGESLDASHGSMPGWEVPWYDVHRRWVFNGQGARIGGETGRGQQFGGLHAYRHRPGRGMWGMGVAVCDESGCYDDGSGAWIDSSNLQPATAGADTATGYLTAGGAPYSGAVYQAPSQNSAQWATFSTNLAKMGFTLAEINSIQPGTVVGANGSILRQSTGLPVPVGGASSLTTAFGGGNSILYIGLAVIAVVAFSGMGKR